MKLVIAILALSLFATTASAAVDTCNPSHGNWVGAATMSCDTAGDIGGAGNFRALKGPFHHHRMS